MSQWTLSAALEPAADEHAPGERGETQAGLRRPARAQDADARHDQAAARPAAMAAGGGLIGDPGISNQGWLAPGGGTENAGGTAGSPPGQAGSLGVGGGPANYHVAGGGGGAYAAGAGGGSSYYGNAMNASTVKGTRAGNGEIKFTW